MDEIAYAKINLALHVRAREPDGYHRLETLFAFAEDGARLHVAEADELTLSVTGPFALALGAADDHLVLRAAAALRGRYDVGRGAALTLDKRLPVASGIGGGSADAAAALRLLVRWWGIEGEAEALLSIASDLGADISACLESRIVRGEGRGDRLSPAAIEGLVGTPLLLVNPGVPVSTAAVFQAWDGVDRGPLTALPGRNDLEAPAMAIAPVIRELLDRLERQEGAALVRMSGSGATCFALFANDMQRDAAGAAIAAARPDWWRLASRLR